MIARMEFVSLLYLEVEPQLSDLAWEAERQGIAVALSGVAGGPSPSVKFRVEGVGEFGYAWRQGVVYRQWRSVAEEEAEPAEREAALSELEQAPAEARALLEQRGFVGT